MNPQSSPQPPKGKAKPQLDNILNELKEQAASIADEASQSSILTSTDAVPINKTLDVERTRKQKIDNDNREKDQQLKEQTLTNLFWFLGIETGVVFLLAFVQGFRLWDFHLDDWSFRLVITATLGQITTMLVIAVQHLFPKKK